MGMNLHTTSGPPRSAARQHTIGRAADMTGVSAKMIRHYEAIGLIPRTGRTAGNYRTYKDSDLHTLRFIQRARTLGFSMAQIRVLLSLWRNRNRSSAQVRKLATDHVVALREKIDSMQAMVRTLETLAQHCHGDDRPDCPILEDLAGEPDKVTSRQKASR
jgi:Cu(I)-responsive transcriptional regulator